MELTRDALEKITRGFCGPKGQKAAKTLLAHDTALRTRLAACEKEALSVGAVSVAQLADWYVTVSNDCVELKNNLAACEADIDHYQRAILVADDKRVQAEARVQALEARLEIDHAYDQDMQRIEIPVEQRDKFPDGIACRDATIQLQDERVKELEQENARLNDYVTQVDHWKQEAVWAANEFMKERECFFQVSYMGQWEMEIAKDPDYQRAQAVLKGAGDE